MRWLQRVLEWLYARADGGVSHEWLKDNERRLGSLGVDQSRSTWPWR